MGQDWTLPASPSEAMTLSVTDPALLWQLRPAHYQIASPASVIIVFHPDGRVLINDTPIEELSRDAIIDGLKEAARHLFHAI